MNKNKEIIFFIRLFIFIYNNNSILKKYNSFSFLFFIEYDIAFKNKKYFNINQLIKIYYNYKSSINIVQNLKIID